MVGTVMFAHGEQKLAIGPTELGQKEFINLGIPLAVPLAYVATFAELIGGLLLVVGLLSRVAALVLLLDRIAALFFGKVYIGRFVAYLLLKVTFESVVPQNSWIGAELDLTLIAGLLVVLLAGPGRLSFDYALGFERYVVNLLRNSEVLSATRSAPPFFSSRFSLYYPTLPTQLA
jgi:putative oxidoreductase